jgi:hypothetical protein
MLYDFAMPFGIQVRFIFEVVALFPTMATSIL